MAINYQDPRFQRLLLRKAAMSPFGGVRGTFKETADFTADQEKMGVALSDVSLRKQMQQAQMEQMKFERGLSERKLGLEQGYLGLEEKGLGLKEKEFGLRERGFGLRERGMGIQEQELGLRSQLQDLYGRESSWKHRQFMRDLADKESQLNLSTWLGLGQTAWTGLESYRRSRINAEDRARQAERDADIKELLKKKRGVENY